eukprot:SM000034S12790  [mRNA]  locus=s34:733799:734767:+ [translate_table: standard]
MLKRCSAGPAGGPLRCVEALTNSLGAQDSSIAEEAIGCGCKWVYQVRCLRSGGSSGICSIDEEAIGCGCKWVYQVRYSAEQWELRNLQYRRRGDWLRLQVGVPGALQSGGSLGISSIAEEAIGCGCKWVYQVRYSAEQWELRNQQLCRRIDCQWVDKVQYPAEHSASPRFPNGSGRVHKTLEGRQPLALLNTFGPS